MKLTLSLVLNVIAIVVFVIAAVYTVADDAPDPEIIQVLLFGGLASFAAAHLPPLP